LTQSLDYLRELGVKDIWQMPFTRNADGDHRDAAAEFRAIAPEYGVAPLQGLVSGSRFAPVYPAQAGSIVTVDASGPTPIALGAQSLRAFKAAKKP
jgi:hypothetical protein